MDARIKVGLGVAAAALGSALTLGVSQPATAQQTSEAERELEVVVTGSRIRRNPVEETAPLQTQTAADIERTGEVSLGEFLQRLPIAGSAINRTNNSSGNLGFPPDGGGIGAGASEIDLRYLGSRRVLVLVDGKRWVRGSSASGVSGAVDLNTIPVDAIDRIEVLQDGASPIYGSDAIAGVVNILTRRDFDGFNGSVHQGQFTEGDGYTQEYNLSWGGSGETWRTFLSAGFARQDAVFAGDRDHSALVVPGASAGVGGSSATPQGRIVMVDPRGDVNGNDEADDILNLTLNTGAVNDVGSLADFNINNPTGGDFHSFGTTDRFNFQPFNYLVTPNRRTNLLGKMEIGLPQEANLTFTGAYTKRESRNQAAPNPLFMGSDAGSGALLDNIFIPADHPYNPFGFDLDGTDNLILLARRPIEAGPRIFEQEVETWIASMTLDGSREISGRSLFWDLNVSFGRNEATQDGFNIFNSRRLAQALGPVSECQQIAGCVPLNIFGGMGANGTGTMTPEMLAFTTFTQHDQSEQELSDVTLNFSGELLKLPAGAMDWALGFEYRKESGSFVPDPAVQAGETADVPASPTNGEVKVNEVYLELRAPLLSERRFFNSLELSAAVRSSDYDRIGRDEVYKAGLYWRVTSDFSARFNFAQGFRAPNIGELFNTGSRFDAALSDPCSNFVTKDPQTVASCQALGVPSSFVQVNPQISVQTGGNPSLNPESSDTWTAGFGYSPQWADNVEWVDDLTFDFTYYNIELDGAIQALNAQDQLDACVSTLDPGFCGGIVRGPGGSIIAFANQLTNIGRVETDGLDFTASLATAPGTLGAFRFTWSNTYIGGYKEFTAGPTGVVGVERAATELGSPTRGLVRWKSMLTTDWQIGAFTTSLVGRYLSPLTEQCPGVLFDFGVESLCSDPANGLNEIGSRLYADAQVAWQPPAFQEKLTVALGMNNVLDKDPPLCRSCDLNSLDGTVFRYQAVSCMRGRGCRSDRVS